MIPLFDKGSNSVPPIEKYIELKFSLPKKWTMLLANWVTISQ